MTRYLLPAATVSSCLLKTTSRCYSTDGLPGFRGGRPFVSRRTTLRRLDGVRPCYRRVGAIGPRNADATDGHEREHHRDGQPLHLLTPFVAHRVLIPANAGIRPAFRSRRKQQLAERRGSSRVTSRATRAKSDARTDTSERKERSVSVHRGREVPGNDSPVQAFAQVNHANASRR